MPTERLLSGHDRFKRGKFASEREVFLRLAEHGQSPKVLWIGCSDSRVIPEQITGAEAGELFMMRNVANIVPPAHAGCEAVGSAVEYAVLHLKISHAVICGHTECGGIGALSGVIDPGTQPNIARWLQWARPAGDSVKRAGIPEGEAYLETIKSNVLLQRDNLLTYPCVAEGVADNRLAVHSWLYDLRAGELLAHDPDDGTWGSVGRGSSAG
jgi:carbonic anhydrase